MRAGRSWEVAWRWCVVDEACGVSVAEVVVMACDFFWGASAGMFFPFPPVFVRSSFVRSFLSYPTKRHFTTYVTRGSCGFINVEIRG